jgi:acyl-CoA reductase-like NAD-dependent aldehyde dehydrogenase
MNAPPRFSDDGSIHSIDPRTWDVLETFPPLPDDAVAAAIRAAGIAQKPWGTTPLKERLQAIGGVLDRIAERGADLAEIIHREHGKSVTEAMFSEVLGAADVVRLHLKFDPKWLKPETVAIDPLSYPGKKGRIEHRPRGILAVIMPWNYPLALPMRTLVPALIAGNAVVFKPSEYALRTGREIGRLFEGLIPEGLLQVLLGGPAVGRALTSSPELGAIAFVGSVRTGRLVAKAAAENLVPVSLELGGKDAAIVCTDADLDRTAAGIAWGAFHNTGQNCAAIERVYVEDLVYDAFLAKLTEYTLKLRHTGPGDDIEIGPLCNANQLKIVQNQLADAVAAGATVVTGGEATGEGWGFPPTILTDVPLDADVWAKETFGPLLPVRKVHSVFEAVDDINASPYGLSCSVWGRETGRAALVAQRCDVGMALVNNHAFTGSIPNAPWVGTKDSGYGVTGSSLAMKFLTRPQLVVVDKNKALEVWWFPLNATALQMARTVLASLVAPLGRKIALTLKLIGLLGKRWKGA